MHLQTLSQTVASLFVEFGASGSRAVLDRVMIMKALKVSRLRVTNESVCVLLYL